MEYGKPPKSGVVEDKTSSSPPYQPFLQIRSVEGGVPIAAVHAGAKTMYNFKPVSESRRMAFSEAASHYLYFEAATSFHNPYVPPRRGPKGGIDKQRRKSIVTNVFSEPLDSFKAERFKSTNQSDTSRNLYRTVGSSASQKKGMDAYNKENKK